MLGQREKEMALGRGNVGTKKRCASLARCGNGGCCL
jgi:hypothetical protein